MLGRKALASQQPDIKNMSRKGCMGETETMINPVAEQQMDETVIIVPGLLHDYLVIENNVILLSPEYALKLIEE